ncbi:MAG: PaaI family thioesterase [Xanthomonadales bacterium]|nr:PaaI family thioesterase [Xanthomonadales bacterium]
MNKQPNSDWCFVCGRKNPSGLRMVFHDNGDDQVVSEYTVGDQYQGYPGIVHGGILASMLDEVVARVSMIGDHHHLMMSVRLNVAYRHSVPTNTPLRIVGTRVKLRGRLGKAQGKIVLPDGTVACESVMTLADVPEAVLDDGGLESLGWRVDE